MCIFPLLLGHIPVEDRPYQWSPGAVIVGHSQRTIGTSRPQTSRWLPEEVLSGGSPVGAHRWLHPAHRVVVFFLRRGGPLASSYAPTPHCARRADASCASSGAVPNDAPATRAPPPRSEWALRGGSARWGAAAGAPGEGRGELPKSDTLSVTRREQRAERPKWATAGRAS